MTEHERRATDENDQLFRIETVERLIRIEAKVEQINGRIARVNAEIGPGLPEPYERDARPTIRGRMHKLENDAAAAKIAAAALEAAQNARRVSETRSWSIKEKTGLFLFAAVAAFASLLRLIGVGG